MHIQNWNFTGICECVFVKEVSVSDLLYSHLLLVVSVMTLSLAQYNLLHNLLIVACKHYVGIIGSHTQY